MKSDIDLYMDEYGIDALLVQGPAQHNPSMTYFTGMVHVMKGFLLKVRGKTPVLYCNDMERDEATRTGFETRTFSTQELHIAAEGDPNLADAVLMERILKEYEVSGRVSIYGKGEAGQIYGAINKLRDRLPDIEIVGESPSTSVLTMARGTKDDEEVERIRSVGEITVAVVGDVIGFLTSHQVKEDVLVDRNGDVLTIGDVKKKINLWLAMRGAENPYGGIFSIGRDAGVPHNSGTNEDPIPIGETIIFDLYPCEVGGGYFHDFTRTWCLGYATDEAQSAYEDVIEVYDVVSEAIRPDEYVREYQQMTCKLFEEKGHPTIGSNPGTLEGYVHSLGHNLGLNIQEAPTIRDLGTNYAKLAPGAVFTIEPGLYYPDRGMGVRIENTVWMKPDGELETLVDFPKDLVIKIPGV